MISADDTFALLAVLLITVAFSLWAETKSWGQTLSAPLLILIISMMLANLNVIPHGAPLYDNIASLLVPLAIPLLLFSADLKKVLAESGPMLTAFVVAVIASIVGAFVGALLIDLGDVEAQVVSALAASYIGGSVNYVATAQAVGLSGSSDYVAALSADTVGAVIYLSLLMLMPASAFIRKSLPSQLLTNKTNVQINTEQSANRFSLRGAVNGLGLSFLLCATARYISDFLNLASMFILILTILALAVANMAKSLVSKLNSEFELGTLCMFVFFAAIGAGANLQEVLGAALPMLLFIVVMVLSHLTLLVVIGRVLKLDLAEVMIASNACILGPATAAALAASKGWRPLITPGMLVGVLGYAIATFIGVSIHAVLN